MAATTIALGVSSFPAASAPASGDFYKGKLVTLYVGVATGGNYAFYARLLGQHLSKHIPGHPSIVVKYMPGAATLVLANYLYNVAPRDGTVFGVIHERMGLLPLINPLRIKYDALKFNWLGAMSSQLSVCFVWHTSTIRAIEDARKREVLVGGTGAGGSSVVFPRVLNDVVGTRFKVIHGYHGTQAIDLAMERGEVEGRCGFGWTALKLTKPDWVEHGKVRIVMQMGMKKASDLPNVPLIFEKISNPHLKASVEFLLGTSIMGRPVVAPPDVPSSRIQLLRDALMATVRDPDFLAQASKQRMEIDPVSGVDIDRLLAKLYAAPQSVIEPVRTWLK